MCFAESDRTEAGSELVCAEGQLGKVGLSICFDLRFPELYQRLTAQGATILAVPSAFTERTGRDHWHALLKARAIENQAYVIAPGQWGEHDDNGLRCSYGHSLIVDPWGTIIQNVEMAKATWPLSTSTTFTRFVPDPHAGKSRL